MIGWFGMACYPPGMSALNAHRRSVQPISLGNCRHADGGLRSPQRPRRRSRIPKNAMTGPATAQKFELVIGLALLIVPRPWNMKIVPKTVMSAPPMIIPRLRCRAAFVMATTLGHRSRTLGQHRCTARLDQKVIAGGGAYRSSRFFNSMNWIKSRRWFTSSC